MINDFSGRYSFLSNFYPSPVVYDGMEYPTVEHAYQAAKTLNPAEREQIRNLKKKDGFPWPGEAKRVGRRVTLRKDWELVKLDIMRLLLVQKFSRSDLKRALVETGTRHLVEGNWWGDTYWGVCKGEGNNYLGRLLMTIRSEINVF